MKLFKPIKIDSAAAGAVLDEESHALLTYARDFLINMVDIAMDKRFL